MHSRVYALRTQMDLVLSPSSLSLTSQLTQITGAGEFAGEEILQTETLWYYTIPPLNRDEFYYQGSLVDETPAEFAVLPYAESDCFVRQLPLGDYSNPTFEVEFNIAEPQGLLGVAYQVGSAPKTDDIIANTRLGGNRLVVPHPLIPNQPIHLTVIATNLNRRETFALCTLPSYDRSPPLARITPIRPVSSHPSKIAALFSLFDEYGLGTPLQVAIGTVPGEHGNDVMDWVNFNLSDISTPPPEDGSVFNLFSFKRVSVYMLIYCTCMYYSSYILTDMYIRAYITYNYVCVCVYTYNVSMCVHTQCVYNYVHVCAYVYVCTHT